MRVSVLGGRRWTFVRAFGPAGVISLKNQEPSGTCGNRRSGVLGRRFQFTARSLGWSDLNRLLEQAGAPAPCQISIPKPAARIAVRYVEGATMPFIASGLARFQPTLGAESAEQIGLGCE
jgi:hypothetical protein